MCFVSVPWKHCCVSGWCEEGMDPVWNGSAWVQNSCVQMSCTPEGYLPVSQEGSQGHHHNAAIENIARGGRRTPLIRHRTRQAFFPRGPGAGGGGRKGGVALLAHTRIGASIRGVQSPAEAPVELSDARERHSFGVSGVDLGCRFSRRALIGWSERAPRQPAKHVRRAPEFLSSTTRASVACKTHAGQCQPST